MKKRNKIFVILAVIRHTVGKCAVSSVSGYS